MKISQSNNQTVARLFQWSNRAEEQTEDFQAQYDHFTSSAERMMAADGSPSDNDSDPGAVLLPKKVRLTNEKFNSWGEPTFTESLKAEQGNLSLTVVSEAVNGIGFGFALESLDVAKEQMEEVTYEIRPDSELIEVTKRAIDVNGSRLPDRRFTMDLAHQSLRPHVSSMKKNLADLIARQYKEANQGPRDERRPYAIAATQNSNLLTDLDYGHLPTQLRNGGKRPKPYLRPG